MELTVEQQIFDQLSHANKVLIALPESLNADAVASGLALALFLKRTEKDVEIASSGEVPQNLRFLPGSELVKPDVAGGKSLVVAVDTSVKKLDEISYQVVDGKVNIYLKPKDGSFTPEDVSFSNDKFPVDVVVALGAKSLDSLGKLFEHHTELFYDTPKINIDNKAGNEYFGAINLVDINASSVAEILSTLFEKYETQLVNEDIATCLLAGIIAKTHSFQHVQTTPRAFLKASELVSLGGRQQEIIRNIYKTKSLPMLKLWGRALARLKLNEDLSLVYSLLNASDFEKAGAGDSELSLVLKELVENVATHKVIALLSENPEGVKILAAVHPQSSPDGLLRQLGGLGKLSEGANGTFKFLEVAYAGIGLVDAETKLLEALKNLKISQMVQ